MTTPQYRSGVDWFDYPEAAIYGTHGGTWHVEYPPPTDMGIDGAPCGATGKPRIVILMPWMQQTGMAFWQSHFASTSDVSVPFATETFDPRAGADVKWLGRLKWPTFESLGRGGTDATTIYRGVRIEIVECEVTT